MQRDTIRRSPFLRGTLAALGMAAVTAAGAGQATAAEVCLRNDADFEVNLKVEITFSNMRQEKKRTDDIKGNGSKKCIKIPANATGLLVMGDVVTGDAPGTCTKAFDSGRSVTLTMTGQSYAPGCSWSR